MPLFCRLVLVRWKRRKEVKLSAYLWLSQERNLFLEHYFLISCLSNSLTWSLTETLSCHTTGKVEVSTSMDTKPVTLMKMNILWMLFHFYWHFFILCCSLTLNFFLNCHGDSGWRIWYESLSMYFLQYIHPKPSGCICFLFVLGSVH